MAQPPSGTDAPEHSSYIKDAYQTLQGLHLNGQELETLAEVLRQAAAQGEESPERVAEAIRKDAPKAADLERLFVRENGGETWTTAQGLPAVLTALIELVEFLQEAEPDPPPDPSDRIINKIRVQSQQPAPQAEPEADPKTGYDRTDPK